MFNNFICICLIFMGLSHTIYASHGSVSLELKEANLQETIRLLAKFLHMNVIISPTVQGVVSLHVNHAAPAHVFDLLLTSQDLIKWPMGHVWLVAPRKELIHQKEEELKWTTVKTESAHLMLRIWTINYGKAEDFAKLLKNNQSSILSQRGGVQVDARTNSICVHDIPEKLEEVARLIKRLDVPVQQVLIEARLASVDHDFERDLGIQFETRPKENSHEKTKTLLSKEQGRYSLAVVMLADGSLLDVKLSALEKAGHAELISSPSLFTASQQPALIEAGEEVPYQEVSESGGTAVVFKKAVLGLKVTPQILPGNKVLLQLQINQDRPSSKMVSGVPTISTRQIITNVLVKSGQTIVLGGIYETNREQGQEGLPFLSQAPLIGWLFTQQNTRKNKRELLIFVTPKIIAQERYGTQTR